MSVAVFATRAQARAASTARPGAASEAGRAARAPSSRDFPELDCIRDRVPAAQIALAEMRAERTATGADSALIAAGAIGEEDYARALARSLATEFEPLEDIERAQCPLDDGRLAEAVATGLLPLNTKDGHVLVLAPRGIAARRMVQIAADKPGWPKRFRFTTRERLVRFALRTARAALVTRACHRLKNEMPLFSAAAAHRPSRVMALLMLAIIAASAVLSPTATSLALSAALAVLFLGWLGLRLLSTITDRPNRVPPKVIADAHLPVYTIIAAIYREARSVEGLLRAIARFDYPVEKLDVILAVEADDVETQDAIARCRIHLPVTTVLVPVAEPRTKPKALNVALPFARGVFTVIFDAEDRPEPDQLRRALDAFRSHGDELACVQARLCIDNTSDSWLTRLFTAEYAAHFDVFLNGLSHLRLPLPLGGSSNHFYTAVLRQVGAWDPYNVTEDADLGIRLARLGYRTIIIDSTTHEEAPARLRPWLRQRTRWFKGWIQTWCVHMRQPRRLLRELGPVGFITFHCVAGGSVLAALVHPLFLGGALMLVTGASPADPDDDTATLVLITLYGINTLAGYLTTGLLGWLGLERRGLLGTAWILLLTPLNWLLLSAAAWRALFQFVVAPYRWEKTEHGLAKSSRRMDAIARSLNALDRELRGLQAVNDSPSLSPTARQRFAAFRPSRTETAHARRPRPRTRERFDAGRERAAGLPGGSLASPSPASE